MNFFRTLFTGSSSKPEPSIINGMTSLYIDSERKNYISIAIDECMTCENLLKGHANKTKIVSKLASLYGDANIENYVIVLYNPNNPYMQQKLSLNCRPYKLINETGNVLILLNKENKPKRVSMYTNENNSTIYRKKKENLKYEFVYSGEILKYSEKKKKFTKKRCGITDNEFIITSSKKQPMVKIKDIEKINYTTTNASSHIKLNDQEKDNLIEIVLRSGKLFYLFRVKRNGEYQNWQNQFNYMLFKRNALLLDESFNNSITDNVNKLNDKYNYLIEHCYSVKDIIQIDDIRNMFFNLFPERLFTDIIKCIIEYKYNHYHYKFIEQWAQFKVMVNYLKIDSGIPNWNNNEIDSKILTVISVEKLAEIKTLAAEVNEMVKNGIDFTIISKEKLRFDLFDELYDNIVERVLSPTYEQNFTLCEDDDASTKKKNGVNTTSQVIAENTSNEHYSGSSNQKKSIEKIMSHYYIKNSSFNTKSFLDLKRDTNAMINSEQK